MPTNSASPAPAPKPRRGPSFSPGTYRRMVVVAGVALAGIVATGAAVRLTQAGLGCEDWPTCSEDRFVPAWQFHAWIEFGNRLLSGAVAAAVAAAVLAAYRRQPRRTDLIRWAWGLVAGVVGQIVLGGITVLVDLHPIFVAAHFLLSTVLLWNVVVLWVRAGAGPGPARARVTPSLLNHGRAVVALAVIVLVSGTVVTGTGPHGGDSRAERLRLDLQSVTQVHSSLVWLLTLTTLTLALRLARADAASARRARWLLGALVAQGAVGYTQYALGLPAGLVEVHVIGSVVVFCLALVLHLGLFERPPVEIDLRQEHGSRGAGTPDSGELAENSGPTTVKDGPLLDTMKA